MYVPSAHSTVGPLSPPAQLAKAPCPEQLTDLLMAQASVAHNLSWDSTKGGGGSGVKCKGGVYV